MSEYEIPWIKPKCHTLTLSIDVPENVSFEEVVTEFNCSILERLLEDRQVVDWAWSGDQAGRGRPVTPTRIGKNNPWEVST